MSGQTQTMKLPNESDPIPSDRIEWAIDQHYRSIDRYNNQRAMTKNWCLGVWLLLLALCLSGKLLPAGAATFVLSFLPIILFWFIEGLQASHMKILEIRVAELEKLWLSGDSRIKKSSDILFYGSHQYQSSKVKLDTFMFAMFRMETVFAFYGLLAFINLLANLIFYTNPA